MPVSVAHLQMLELDVKQRDKNWGECRLGGFASVWVECEYVISVGSK